MKKKYIYDVNGKKMEREYNYIPVRYILAMLITVLEVMAVIGAVVACCYFIPYFYLAAYVTQVVCVVRIISSDENPDYKVPWLLFVMILPIAGFMLYFLFYSRKLQKKYVRRLKELKRYEYNKDDAALFEKLKTENPVACSQAKMLTDIAGTSLFTDTAQEYFPLGEDMWPRLLEDLRRAEKFIYMEYFIIEEGEFWNSILQILKEKAAAGLDVRVVYDDIGCMSTLPGNYAKKLGEFGIKAAPFSVLKGQADSEFNNRSHRKITSIDGFIAYTGGVNIADEYINKIERFGHWKDIGIRLEGQAAWEMTRLFMTDYGINVKELSEVKVELYPKIELQGEKGYLIPFGDGPHPLYNWRVGKSVIQNMVNDATRYAFIMTPYLIIDNEMCQCFENAALKGVDVRIIVPHIPDKKLVFGMTRSFYPRLMSAGVKIYEYEPGFVHAKAYLVDDEYAMIGTINLDYRSLVHHFENGVWMYGCASINDLKKDFVDTFDKSILITDAHIKTNLLQKIIRSVVRIFAPLL